MLAAQPPMTAGASSPRSRSMIRFLSVKKPRQARAGHARADEQVHAGGSSLTRKEDNDSTSKRCPAQRSVPQLTGDVGLGGGYNRDEIKLTFNAATGANSPITVAGWRQARHRPGAACLRPTHRRHRRFHIAEHDASCRRKILTMCDSTAMQPALLPRAVQQRRGDRLHHRGG